MSAPKFTSGPWKCDAEDPRYIRSVRTKEYIAARQSSNSADQKLIAAAPELYEALQSIEREARDANSSGDVVIPSNVWDQVRAALAKAVTA